MCIAHTIFYKSVQLLAYANDINIIGRTMRDVTVAFSVIERASTKMDLAVNERKTKYMLWDVRHIWSQITAKSCNCNCNADFCLRISGVEVQAAF